MANPSYNCTIVWKIENFFCYPLLSSPCVPIAEVETFSSEKWKLELKFREEGFLTLKMVKVSGDLDMPTERRVVTEIEDELLNKLSIGRPSREQPQSVREMLFDFDCTYEDCLQNGYVVLKIELRFLVDDLALSTTVRTVFKAESCSFHWSLKDISKGFHTLEYPVPVHMPGLPEIILCFLIRKHPAEGFALGLKKGNNVAYLGTNSRSTHYKYVGFIIKGNINNRKKDITGCELLSSMPEVLEITSIDIIPENIDVECYFLFWDGTSESIQLETAYSSFKNETSFVMDKFPAGESLLKNMNFSDVTLKAGSKQFKAHRSVLSSVSPVFNAMFENEMSETVTGEVNIEDVEPSTLKEMLKFVYTGETGDWSFDQYEKLMAAAHKYSISSLRDLCSHRLVSLLTMENVVRVLHLGYLYNDERLKSAAKSLFSTNPSFILKSKEWNDYIEGCFPSECSPIDKLKKSLQTIKERASSIVPPSVSTLFKKKDGKKH